MGEGLGSSFVFVRGPSPFAKAEAEIVESLRARRKGGAKISALAERYEDGWRAGMESALQIVRANRDRLR